MLSDTPKVLSELGKVLSVEPDVLSVCSKSRTLLECLENGRRMQVSGIASYQELRAEGWTRRQIDQAIATGTIRRLAIGWYGTDQADANVVRALGAHARLGCVSGAAFHGLWVPEGLGLHAVQGAGQVPPNAPGIHFHVSKKPQPKTAVWSVLDCVDHVVQRHGGELALIVLDSALNLGLANADDVIAILKSRGEEGHRLGTRLGWAESGSETRVRLFLTSRKIPVTPQATIPGVGRVDLLVGDSLIIECDSRAHHTATDRMEEDRRRDLAARDAGYDTIRLTYAMIWHRWPATRQSLLKQIRRRQHRRPGAGRLISLD